MKKSIVLSALLCLLSSHVVTAQADAGQEINLNQDLFLTVEQRQTLSVEAMRGSAEAASKLFLFYGFVALNPTEEHRWVVVGAENGDPVAQYNLYQDLIDSEDKIDKERARYWLRKAAGGGDETAQAELKNIEGPKVHSGKSPDPAGSDTKDK